MEENFAEAGAALDDCLDVYIELARTAPLPTNAITELLLVSGPLCEQHRMRVLAAMLATAINRLALTTDRIRNG